MSQTSLHNSDAEKQIKKDNTIQKQTSGGSALAKDSGKQPSPLGVRKVQFE